MEHLEKYSEIVHTWSVEEVERKCSRVRVESFHANKEKNTSDERVEDLSFPEQTGWISEVTQASPAVSCLQQGHVQMGQLTHKGDCSSGGARTCTIRP